MADTFTRAERSRIMAAVKSKDTTPELSVRRLVHSLGYRFRLHVRTLPGTPDLVFPRLRKAINVNGCFWHLHGCLGVACRRQDAITGPKSCVATLHGQADTARAAPQWLAGAGAVGVSSHASQP